jgi:eukaryotic-like serine/threonine-protein kinase
MAKLGHGGMADVYLATARGPSGFNKLTVLKVLRPHLSGDPQFLTMFLDEARLAARLNHPNVVQTNEVGSTEHAHYLAMEYLEGQPLFRISNKLRAAKRIELPHNLRILCDALAALQYAHDLADYDGTPLSVVHRDVSPHNLFVTYTGQVKLLDFGIAKALTSVAETSPGVLKGKVTYMAPEQAWGDQVDRRADVFAVGIMLWEALTGRRLWLEAEGNVLQRLVNGKIPTPSSVAPWVLERLEQITMKALAVDKEERYPTAAAFRADLLDALDELGRPDEDALSRLVVELFANDRKLIRTVIDEQLRRVDQEDPTGALASLPSLDQVAGVSASGASGGSGASAGSGASGASGGSEQTRSTKIESRSVTLSARSRTQASPRSRQLMGVMAVGAALAAAITFAVVKRGAGEATAPPAPAAPPLEAAPPAPAKIHVQIVVSPPEARLLLDGKPLPSNPYAGTEVADSVEHEVRAEADGYVALTKRVTFGADVTQILRLERSEKPADATDAGAATGTTTPRRPLTWPSGATPSASTSATSPTPAPPTSALVPAPAASSPGGLDWKDPWAK